MSEGRVVGIGGVFVRAEDSRALASWYREYLGIDLGDVWGNETGTTVVAAFDRATAYWPENKPWMLSLRVVNLDALLARLTAAGIPTERRPGEWDDPDIGRFARIEDPEGHAIELWEPAI